MRRTETCNGNRLAELRTSLGFSQSALAEKAGYSERLIRKAESGESVTFKAIESIAQALSVNGNVTHAEDLICNPTQLVKQFLHAFANFEAEMVSHVQHFIDENFVLYCAGDQANIPFAGEWNGVEGLDQWVRCFFNTFNAT